MRSWLIGLLACLLVVLAGCGGGDDDNTPAEVTGAAVFTLVWDNGPLPEGANSVVVSVLQDSTPIAQQVENRPTSGSTSTVTSTGLPVGALRYLVTAFTDTQGTGVVLGSASGDFQVQAGATTQVPVTPSGYAVSLSVNPDEGFTDTFFQLHVIVINASDDQAYEDYQARWDFDGDGVYDTPYGDDHFMRHQYTQPGTYNPRVEVRDDHGVFAVAGSMVVVTLEGAVPAAVLPWVSPESGTTATDFQLGCTLYDSNDQLAFSGSVRWDWEDDGSYDTPFVSFATSDRAAADHIAPVFTHRYATPGDKRARVQGIAPSGRVATKTILITVR